MHLTPTHALDKINIREHIDIDECVRFYKSKYITHFYGRVLKIWYKPCIIRQYIHSKTATNRASLKLTGSREQFFTPVSTDLAPSVLNGSGSAFP